MGDTRFDVGCESETSNLLRRGEAGHVGQLLLFSLEDRHAVGGVAGLAEGAVVHQEQEVVVRNRPAAEEGTALALLFEVAIVVVELLTAVRNAYHACRQLRLLTSVLHRLGVGGGEDVDVAVACLPDHLVVLRLLASAGITDFAGLDNLLAAEGLIVEDSDPAGVRVLGPLQLILLVGAAVRAAGFGLDQVLISGENPLPVPILCAVLAESHRDGNAIELLVVLQDTG